MTTEQLAIAAQTTQPTITRLETGRMRLTDKWMERIAKALEVEPYELMVASSRLDTFENEVEPFNPTGYSEEIASTSQLFKVLISTLDKIHIKVNEVILVDTSEAAINNRRTGDVVVAKIQDENDPEQQVYVLRQYLAPSSLIPNSRSIDTPPINTEVVHTEIIGIKEI